MISTVERTVLYNFARAHFTNHKMYMQNIYSKINDVRLRAIQSSEEECQTHYCQYNSIDIGNKFQTEKIITNKDLT